MTALRSLKINRNLIETLPEELGGLEHLVELDCVDNPVRYPPKAIAYAGCAAVKPFFQAVLKHGTECNTDLKVRCVHHDSLPHDSPSWLPRQPPRRTGLVHDMSLTPP